MPRFGRRWSFFKSSASSCSISSTTPAPRAPRITKSTCRLTTSSALSTAAEASHNFKNASSFSASPMPTVLWCDSPSLLSAACRPVALFTPVGSIITAPLLKMICSSRPRSRIVCSTVVSCGSQVATITSPTSIRGTPRRASVSTNSRGGGSVSVVTSSVSRIVKHGTVVGDDEIAQTDLRENVQQLLDDATGDQHQLSARFAQSSQGVDGRIIDDAIRRQRAVVIDSQCVIKHERRAVRRLLISGTPPDTRTNRGAKPVPC